LIWSSFAKVLKETKLKIEKGKREKKCKEKAAGPNPAQPEIRPTAHPESSPNRYPLSPLSH
jgi:hypothetical protein